jgi:hypothetical protein
MGNEWTSELSNETTPEQARPLKFCRTNVPAVPIGLSSRDPDRGSPEEVLPAPLLVTLTQADTKRTAGKASQFVFLGVLKTIGYALHYT